MTLKNCNFNESLFIKFPEIDMLSIEKISIKNLILICNEIKNNVLIKNITKIKKIDLRSSKIYGALTLFNLEGDGSGLIDFSGIKCNYFNVKCKEVNRIMFNDIFIEKRSKINIYKFSNKKFKIRKNYSWKFRIFHNRRD